VAIPPPQFTAPNTWRGFLIRVATIAVAALIVLGAMDLFEYLHDPHPAPHPAPHPYPESTPPVHEDVP
jgi:hypothetical protein